MHAIQWNTILPTSTFFFKSTSTTLLRSNDSAKLAGQGAQGSSCLSPWTWDYLCTVLFPGLSVYSAVPGNICVQYYSWDYLCTVLLLGLSVKVAVPGIIHVQCYSWDYLCTELFLGLSVYSVVPGTICIQCYSWDYPCTMLSLTFKWVLEIELRSSCFDHKYFSKSIISSALQINTYLLFKDEASHHLQN